MGVVQSIFGRSGGGSDPLWANVVSLLWFNGNLTDQRGKTWTARNSAATSSVQSKFGGSSLLLTTTQSIDTPDSSDFNFPGQFCIDCWVYYTTRGTISEIFNRDNVTSGLKITVNSSGQLSVEQIGGSVLLSTSGAIPLNQWVHVAVSRESAAGGTLRIFFDGAFQNGTTGINNDFSCVAIAQVGSNIGSTFYVDDYRVTKGVPRYIDTFTPPTFQAPNA